MLPGIINLLQPVHNYYLILGKCQCQHAGTIQSWCTQGVKMVQTFANQTWYNSYTTMVQTEGKAEINWEYTWFLPGIKLLLNWYELGTK